MRTSSQAPAAAIEGTRLPSITGYVGSARESFVGSRGSFLAEAVAGGTGAIHHAILGYAIGGQVAFPLNTQEGN